MNFITRRSYQKNNFLSNEFSAIYKDGYESISKDTSKLRRDITQKTEELEKKEREIEELTIKLNKYKNENSKLKAECSSKELEYDKIERENKRIKARLLTLEKEKKIAEEELEELNVSFRRIEANLNVHTKKVGEESNVIQLKKIIEELKGEKELLERRNKELQNRIRSLNNDNRTQSNRTFRIVNTEKQESETQIVNLQKEITVLQTENNELKRKIKSLENLIQKETSKGNISSKEIEFDRQKQLLESKISSLKKELSDNRDKERELIRKLEIEQNEVRNLKKELIRAQQNANSTIKANNKSTEENFQRLRELQKDYTTLKSLLDESEKKRNEHLKEIDMLNYDKQLLMNDINKLKNDKIQMYEELKVKNAKIEKLENDIIMLNKDIHIIQEKHLAELQSTTKEYESITQDYILEKKKLDEYIANLQLQIQNYQVKLKENDERIEALVKELKVLKNDAHQSKDAFEIEKAKFEELITISKRDKTNLELQVNILQEKLKSINFDDKEKALVQSINKLSEEKEILIKERDEALRKIDELNKILNENEKIMNENRTNDTHQRNILLEEKKLLEENQKKFELEIKNLREEKFKLDQTIKELEVKIENYVKKIEILHANTSNNNTSDILVLNDKINSLENDIANYKLELDKINTENSLLSKENHQQKNSLEQLNQNIKDLKDELIKSNENYEKEKESHKNTLYNHQILADKIIELQKNLNEYKKSDAIEPLDKVLEMKDKEISKLKIDKEALQISLSQKEEEISNILKNQKSLAGDNLKKKRISKSRESLLQSQIETFKAKFSLLIKASESDPNLKSLLKTIEVDKPQPVLNNHYYATLIQSYLRGYKERKSYKNIKYRHRKVIEIYETEKSYVETLDLIYYYYYLPLKEMIKINEPILTHEEIDHIFCGIEKIREKNREILKLLEERISNWHIDQAIGDIFVHIMEKSMLYPHIKYIQNYNQNREFRLNLMNTNKAFNRFIKITMILPVMEGKSLDDLLINPVQRIPRYILLLNDLIKSTKATHPDHFNISNGLRLVQEFTAFLNENNRRNEMMMDISSRLSGLDLPENPKRVLLHEGRIIHINEKEKNPRYAFLFSDCIVFAKDVKKKKKSLKTQKPTFSIIANIKLNSNVSVQAIGEYEQGSAFSITISGQENIFLTQSQNEMIYWVTQIKDALSSINGSSKLQSSHSSGSLLQSENSYSESSSQTSKSGKRKSAKRS